MNNILKMPEIYSPRFHNLSDTNMNFEQIFERILYFMKQDPMGNYKLMIGSDSQVQRRKRRTVFITGIVIQRVGKGAWGCIRKTVINRKMTNIYERISLETSLTEEVAYMFTNEHKTQLIDIILPNIYKGSSFSMEGHLDIGMGYRNKTGEFINEMVARIEALGIEAKIKPESIIASAYANRFTK